MISDEAVEAAARALWQHHYDAENTGWEQADRDAHWNERGGADLFRAEAQAALEAALPHLLDREKVARLIDPPFWADLDDTLKWLESQGGKYEAGWPRFRFLKRELAHVMELYDRADAILTHPQKGGEG